MRHLSQLRRSGLIPALVASVVLVSNLSAAGDPNSLHDEVLGALRWYFHWQEPVPQEKRLICRAQKFEDSYFVYCDPRGMTLDLTAVREGGFKVNVITSTLEDFSTVLRMFAARQRFPATASMVVPIDRDDLTDYEVEEKLSRRRMDTTMGYMRETLLLYEQRGQHVRCLFPLVSEGDPFYDVYLVQDDHVDSVWHFPVIGGVVQDHPQWVYDVPHHNIPSLAESLAKNASRWLASIP